MFENVMRQSALMKQSIGKNLVGAFGLYETMRSEACNTNNQPKNIIL